MKKILITGGTTFVSKYVAQYFLNNEYDVYVLNRNSKSQVEGVKLIEGDRHNLGNKLKDIHFDWNGYAHLRLCRELVAQIVSI